MRGQTGMSGNDGNCRPVGQALRQTDDEIALVDELQIEKRARLNVEHHVAGQTAGDEGNGGDPDDETNRHHDARDKPRLDEVVDGIRGAHAQSVDLFGHDHGSDLGGDARTHARGEHQRADRGREIADHQLHVRRADQAEFGNDPRELKTALKHEDHSDEPHHDGQEHERSIADLEHLVEHGPCVRTTSDAVVERLDKHREQLEACVKQVQRFATDGLCERRIQIDATLVEAGGRLIGFGGRMFHEVVIS